MSSQPKDFNDMAQLSSSNAVKHTIDAAEKPTAPIPAYSGSGLSLSKGAAIPTPTLNYPVMMEGIPSGVAEIIADTPTEASQDYRVFELVEELNNSLAMVFSAGQTLILTETLNDKGQKVISLGKIADVKLLYANQLISITNGAGVTRLVCVIDVWEKAPNRRTYPGGIVFEPEGASEDRYNMFQGLATQPVKGDCSLYLEHIRENICQGNELFYDYVLGWMAHMIQRPGTLPEVAIVLKGEEGVGKGVFVDELSKLLSPYYIAIASMDQLLGRFGGHLMGKILVYVNEATWGGNKAAEGAFKAMITDKDETVEEKFKSPIRLKNCKHFIVSSNEDWPVAMGRDSRRFFVLEVGSKQKENNAYFSAIIDQMRNGGSEALMYELLNHDLSNFNVRKIPDTPYSFAIKFLSMNSAEKFIYEFLREDLDAYQTGHIMRKDSLHHLYHEWCKDNKERFPQAVSTFGKSLKKLIPSITSMKTTCTDEKGSFRKDCYVFQCMKTCRSEFAKACKEGAEIWE